jgi:EF-P beta-lysylation protein EpmB
MIPRIPDPEHRPAWQLQLARAVRSVDELLRLLDIDPTRHRIQPLVSDFPLRVPHAFVARMARGDIHDPLLRQVLPLSEETRQVKGFVTDPLGELDAMPSPGLLHKYRGRALLTVTGACAVHCRYCFRRHFPYPDANPAGAQWEQAIDYLARHPDIHEIILSGGDPLSLPDHRLQALSERLSTLPQLRTLRIHSRLPIVLPERIDRGLLGWIGQQRLRVVLVVHCNHANEIDEPVARAMQRLAQAGVTLLNQSVLLRGVNDDAGALIHLSESLFDAGILPYYLHRLDRVQGTAHFEVDAHRTGALYSALHAALPGYLVPRLVEEIPGNPGKSAVRWP